MSVTASTTTATNAKALDWMIGTTRASSDNDTTSEELILTVQSNFAGTILDTVTGTLVTVTTNSTGNYTELAAATYTADPDDDTGLNTQTQQVESRGDVRLPDDGTAAATSNAVSYNRVHWLG